MWSVSGLLKTANMPRLWINGIDYSGNARGEFKHCQNTSQSTYFTWCNVSYWRTKHPQPRNEGVVTQKLNNFQAVLSCSSKYVLFVVGPTFLQNLHAQHIVPSRPARSGARILILVRQPDPRFTPRVWLVPIVHCQGLLMERQQWIPSPHKWLSDRAPSSITSYNVEVQKMRPSGGLIWCFICSYEELLSFPSPPAK